LLKTLNKDQIIEYELIRNLSEKLIIEYYDRNTSFELMIKTSIGYTVLRSCCLKKKKIMCLEY
jgi:hypothetical protein